MKRFSLLLSMLLLTGTLLLHAGETIRLTHGLICPLPEQPRRTFLSADPVEALLVAGKKVMPMAGDQMAASTETWRSIVSDSSGWFDDPALGNGWVHFRVTRLQRSIFLLEGMGHSMVYVNGTPRIGNRYRSKDLFESWEPRFDFGLIPIQLEAGENHLLFRCSRGRLKVLLHPLAKTALFNPRDLTLPDLRAGESLEGWGGIPVLNGTDAPLAGLVLRGHGEGIRVAETVLPELLPLGVRKVVFPISAGLVAEIGEVNLILTLVRKTSTGEELLDETAITLRRLPPGAPGKYTFISTIDGSVQHYAIQPATGGGPEPKALFLTLHGAGVEALNQAGSYAAKSWGHIVAPTNRRPYGHNWEDWGRMDALEVLALTQKSLAIDTSRIYLTGHSMGGHGTWHLGALYPDRFAAIAPSAGWISFWTYGLIDTAGSADPARMLLRRASLPGNTLQLAENYGALGIYILHGAADDNVPAGQSVQMVKHLSAFHHDYIYHEQPEAGHWWDLSDGPGTDCVDWAPLFDFFARHVRPGAERTRWVDFITVNPGISARNTWLTIVAQQHPLAVSRAQIAYDPAAERFSGVTENITRLALRPPVTQAKASCQVELDGQELKADPAGTLWFEKKEGRWRTGAAPAVSEKGPHRNGPFKEAFQRRMIFVYGTRGSATENRWALNKARFDAECFWYQANGAVDVVADVAFDPEADKERSVILYGNAATNAAWKRLLGQSSIQVDRSRIRIGKQLFRGDDLAALFIQPRPGSECAYVAVVAGTAPAGMRLTSNLPYLYAGTAFPDFIVLSSALLQESGKGIVADGFFDNQWGLQNAEVVITAGERQE
jgi:dienelactone hydrolase